MSDLIKWKTIPEKELIQIYATYQRGYYEDDFKNYFKAVEARLKELNAPAIEQGEPVAELKITWGSDTGYEYGLTLIGGALASQKEYDDWIVRNFKGEGVFKLYTTPQQPHSVEEAANLVFEIMHMNGLVGTRLKDKLVEEIRALIKRNTEGWSDGTSW